MSGQTAKKVEHEMEAPALVDEDGRELTQVETAAPLVPEQTPMAFIAAAIANDMDVEKLEKLMDLQERYENRNAQKEFIQAMAEFQSICPSVFRSKDSDKHSYAPLETIIASIRPALQKTGLSVRFDSEINENSVTAICKVSHAGGFTEESRFTCPVERLTSNQGKRIMNDAQALASASSYAKRYAVKNAFNIVESYEDDDAEGTSSNRITPEQAARLREEIEALGGEEKFFCNFLRKGIDSFDDVPEGLLAKAQKAIKEQKAARS